MRGILYLSRACTSFCKDSIQELESAAKARNQLLEITGYLCYINEYFIQYIEGPDEAVDSLMARISQDPRHTILNTIYDEELEKRRFPDWHMQWLQQAHMLGVEQQLSDYLLVLKDWDQQTYQKETVLRLLDVLSDDQALLAV